MVRCLWAVLTSVHVCAAGARTPTREAPQACRDSSSLLQSDVRVEGPAAQRARGGRRPRLEETSVGLLSTDAQAFASGAQGPGPQKPSRWKYIVAWAAPFVFLLGSWLLPWMYGRGAGKGEGGGEEAPEEGKEDEAAAEPETARSGPPAGMLSVLARMAPIWPPIILYALAQGISGPGANYIGVNFFARKYTDLPWSQIHCELDPNQPHCSKGVMDLTQVNTYVGLVAPIVQILLGPALGSLSDAYGRRPVLISVWVLGFLPQIFVASHLYRGTSLWMSYYLVPLSDLPSSAVSYAYVIDIVRDPKSLALAFGLQSAAGTFFNLLGMIIGSKLTLTTAFTAGFIITVATLAYIVLLFPESLPAAGRRPMQLRAFVPGFGLGILVRNELLARLAYFAAGATFADAGFNAVTGSWLQLYMKWTFQASYIAAILGSLSSIVWLTLGMRLLVGWLREPSVLTLSRWCGLASGIIFLVSREPWHVYLIQVFFRGPVAMGIPCIAAMKGQLISPSEQGLLQSALNTLTSIAGSVGPLCFGIIFRATNSVDGVRTKESNTMLYYGILQSVPLLLVLMSVPQLMRKYLPQDGASSLKSKKLSQ